MKHRIALHAAIAAPFADVVRAFDNRTSDAGLLPDVLSVQLSADTTVHRRIRVSHANMRRNSDGIVCELRLEAEQRPRAFPTFDGTLLVRGGPDHDTSAWLIGDYEHPLGVVGATAAVIAGDRLARQSLQAMFDSIVEALRI